MATKSEWRCPICYDDQEDVARVSPCLHQLCLGCALRWARQNPSCPLCRVVTTAVLLPLPLGDEHLTFDVLDPMEPSAGDSSDEDARPLELLEVLSLVDPAELAAEDSPVEQESAAQLEPIDQLGGFSPEVWAEVFNSRSSTVRPLLPWLRRELGPLYGYRWWEVAKAESSVVGLLCSWGLDEQALVHRLQSSLGDATTPFVRRLVAAAVRLCHGELLGVLRQLEPLEPCWEDDSPAASPAASPSPAASGRSSPDIPAGSDVEDEADGPEEAAGASQPILAGAPECPRPTPVPATRGRPRDEPGRAAVAGPSARHRGRSPGVPQRPPKRRAPAPQDSPRRR